MASGASEHDPGMGTYVGIWAGFLAIVGIEVFITYQRPETKHLLFTLLILAAIEALVGLALLHAHEVRAKNPILDHRADHDFRALYDGSCMGRRLSPVQSPLASECTGKQRMAVFCGQ